ncbi:MAG: hemerythrin [Nitrospirae bacterium GWD2_57_9]|nr:MAG: hemerythrin [Nitrospirae bacterium GWD2_57_9]OGW45092.1 MAG: hemerythrin [Nitrospirae bacterium GWC2_57_9]
MQELNVTTIIPRDRHPLIFKTFDALKQDESFVITNDHDPKPLYYSFLHEREGLFGWEYLAEGPEEWKVKITRK